MTRRWFTSDTHFGHSNIIRYAGRPYGNVQRMNADIVERHNACVAPDDDVWWLGDIALGNVADSLEWVQLCNGKKTLVVGNHDKPFQGPKRRRPPSPEVTQLYADAGFETIIHGFTELELITGLKIVACHFPYAGDSHDTDRSTALRPVNRGQWLLCGHIHEKWRQLDRQINVGVDAWAGRPVSEETIISLIKAGPASSPPLEWT